MALEPVPVLPVVRTAAAVAADPGAAVAAAVVSARCSRRHVASAAMRLRCRFSREVIVPSIAAIAFSRFVRLAKFSDIQITSTLRRRGCLFRFGELATSETVACLGDDGPWGRQCAEWLFYSDAFGDSVSDEGKLLVGHIGWRYLFDALFGDRRDRMSYRIRELRASVFICWR